MLNRDKMPMVTITSTALAPEDKGCDSGFSLLTHAQSLAGRRWGAFPRCSDERPGKCTRTGRAALGCCYFTECCPSGWLSYPGAHLQLGRVESSAFNNVCVVLFLKVPYSCDCGLNSRPLPTLVPHLNLGAWCKVFLYFSKVRERTNLG